MIIIHWSQYCYNWYQDELYFVDECILMLPIVEQWLFEWYFQINWWFV